MTTLPADEEAALGELALGPLLPMQITSRLPSTSWARGRGKPAVSVITIAALVRRDYVHVRRRLGAVLTIAGLAEVKARGLVPFN